MRIGQSRSAQQPSLSLLNNRHAESPSSFRTPVGRSLHCLPGIDLKVFKKFNPLNLLKKKPKAFKWMEQTTTTDKYSQLAFAGVHTMAETDPRQPKRPKWEIQTYLVPRRASSLQGMLGPHVHSSAATEAEKQSGVDFFKHFFSGKAPPHPEATEITALPAQPTGEPLSGRHYIDKRTKNHSNYQYREVPSMAKAHHPHSPDMSALSISESGTRPRHCSPHPYGGSTTLSQAYASASFATTSPSTATWETASVSSSSPSTTSPLLQPESNDTGLSQVPPNFPRSNHALAPLLPPPTSSTSASASSSGYSSQYSQPSPPAPLSSPATQTEEAAVTDDLIQVSPCKCTFRRIVDEIVRVLETYLENFQMCEHCYGRFQSRSPFLSSPAVPPQQQPQPQQQHSKSELELVYEKLHELSHALSQLDLRRRRARGIDDDDDDDNGDDKEIIDDEHIDNLFDMICNRITPSGYVEVPKEDGLEAVNLYLVLQQVSLRDYEYGCDHQIDAETDADFDSGSGSQQEDYSASTDGSLTTLTLETHARISQLLML